MATFANWLNASRVIDPAARAVAAWNRIQQKPSTVTVVRLTPITQARTTHEVTVRLEFDNNSDEYNTVGNSGVNIMGECVAFGVCDHPTEPDLDLVRDDVFYYNGFNFRVINLIPTIGEIQALCEAQR